MSKLSLISFSLTQEKQKLPLGAILVRQRSEVRRVLTMSKAGAVKYLWGNGCCIGGLILLKQLEGIATLRNIGDKTLSSRSSFVFKLAIGTLTPFVLVPIHYAVQSHRIDEFQGMGCFVPVYPSYPALFLIMTYPIVVTLVSTIYASK